MQFSLSGKLSLPRRVASSTIKIEIRAEIDVSPQVEKDYTTYFSINSYMELLFRDNPTRRGQISLHRAFGDWTSEGQ